MYGNIQGNCITKEILMSRAASEQYKANETAAIQSSTPEIFTNIIKRSWQSAEENPTKKEILTYSLLFH
ncbi:hypothetical protein MR642_03415 [bacterium]|nr:hypothetical protein [bacterium]